ncbi:hypothetical protein [Natronospora cellulosivora (SeqCode)]
MKLSLLAILLLIIISFNITVLFGLIQSWPLDLIFFSGLRVILFIPLFYVSVFFLFNILSKSRFKNDKSDDASGSDINNSKEGKNKNDEARSEDLLNQDSSDSFSPLSPTVLEVAQEERGELSQ